MNVPMFSTVADSADKVIQAKRVVAVVAQLTKEADDGTRNIELAAACAMARTSGIGALAGSSNASSASKAYSEFLDKIDFDCVEKFLYPDGINNHTEGGRESCFKDSISFVLFDVQSVANIDADGKINEKLRGCIEGIIDESLRKKEPNLLGGIKSRFLDWRKILLDFVNGLIQSLRQKSFRLAMVLGLIFTLFGVAASGSNVLQPLSSVVILIILGIVLYDTINASFDSIAKSKVDDVVDKTQAFLLGVAGYARDRAVSSLGQDSTKLQRLCHEAAGVAVQRDESFESQLSEVQQEREAWAGLVVGTYARAMKELKAGSKEQAAEGGAEKPVKVRKSAARSRMRATLEGVERSLWEEFKSIDAARLRLIVSRVRREVFSGFDIGLAGDIESDELVKSISECSKDLVAKARHLLKKEVSTTAVSGGGAVEPADARERDAGGLKISQARMLLKKSLEDIERDLWVEFKGTLSATGFRFVIANERREIDAVFALNFREEPVAGNDFEEWRETHCEEFRGSATDGLTKRREAEKAEVEKAKKAEAERKRLEEAARRPPAEEGA